MKNLFLIVALFFITACDDGDLNMKHKVEFIQLTLGASIQEALDCSPIKFSQGCMEGLDLCWYKINKSANEKYLPSVVIGGGDGGG